VRFAGEIHQFEPSFIDGREQKRMDRFCLLGLGAAEDAVKDCGFDFHAAKDPYRNGVVIGSGIGGILTIEEGHSKLLKTGPNRISPFTVPRLMVNAAAGNVSIRHNLKGANSATATACATSGHAIGHAFHYIQRGDADVMLAGGSEAAIGPLCIGSFAAMKALSTRNDDPERSWCSRSSSTREPAGLGSTPNSSASGLPATPSTSRPPTSTARAPTGPC
jgi:3-oxoacyl-[acyl-carrier-protein] synthase II